MKITSSVLWFSVGLAVVLVFGVVVAVSVHQFVSEDRPQYRGHVLIFRYNPFE